MGKNKRYNNRLEMWLSSEFGRRVLGFIYSTGAAVIIIGALFKLLHLQYGNTVLFVAMVVEACVFFISGFDRPMSDYQWEDVFPVLKSKNPLDRPDFTAGNGSHAEGAHGVSNLGGGTIVIGDLSGVHQGGAGVGEQVVIGGSPPPPIQGGGMGYIAPQAIPVTPPTPQELVHTGMASMGLNISEKDAEMLAESIKKLNSAAEQISKMADLTEATQSYIDRISSVSNNLEKFNEITGSLGEVSDSLINSCQVITGKSEDPTGETPKSYVENMSKLNDNLSGLNHFYETQLTGIRSQMDTILHINAGLNRIRDLYDSSIVDSATFRNENERMAQLLAQLNQVYSRLLQAMTVNIQSGAYPPPAGGYQQPPYQGGYQPQTGGFR